MVLIPHITLLLTISISTITQSLPLSFAEIEESWNQGLSEKDIHATNPNPHPTPSWLALHSTIEHFPPIPHVRRDTNEDSGSFESALDERTMAVRAPVSGSGGIVGVGKVIGEVVGGVLGLRWGDEDVEVQVRVLRPVRGRRWEFR